MKTGCSCGVGGARNSGEGMAPSKVGSTIASVSKKCAQQHKQLSPGLGWLVSFAEPENSQLSGERTSHANTSTPVSSRRNTAVVRNRCWNPLTTFLA